MIKTFILLVILGFGILYGIQLAAYYSIETQKELPALQLRGYDPVIVKIMLGGNPNDKFIPGVGAYRILTDEPLRIQVEYKGQIEFKEIMSAKDVDMESFSLVPYKDKLYVYYTFKGNKTSIELKK